MVVLWTQIDNWNGTTKFKTEQIWQTSDYRHSGYPAINETERTGFESP